MLSKSSTIVLILSLAAISPTNPSPSRPRRSYTSWSGALFAPPPYPSLAAWKAPLYPLSRPYFIPIFGAPGRLPIYYPPQALRPQRPYQGPAYLPPAPPVENRFGDGDDAIHFPKESDEAAAPAAWQQQAAPTRAPPTPSTFPPVEKQAGGGGAPAQAQPSSVQPARVPSRCIWAITACCSADGRMDEGCFEARGCGGLFFDNSPCSRAFLQAALESTLNYYDN